MIILCSDLRPGGTVEQCIRSYWSAWKPPPAYSVGHEKLISTTHWDLTDILDWVRRRRWTKTLEEPGELEAVWMFVVVRLQYLVAICCLADRKYESLDRAPPETTVSRSATKTFTQLTKHTEMMDSSAHSRVVKYFLLSLFSPLNTSHYDSLFSSQECREFDN